MKVNDLHQNYDFSGKTVVIIGGGGVLGGEMAVTLAWFGANVAILDRCPVRASSGAPGR